MKDILYTNREERIVCFPDEEFINEALGTDFTKADVKYTDRLLDEIFGKLTDPFNARFKYTSPVKVGTSKEALLEQLEKDKKKEISPEKKEKLHQELHRMFREYGILFESDK